MQTQVDLRSRHFFNMDISEVSKRSGLPASTLRYYEERGLIASVGRQGLRRMFAPEVLEQLALISLGQAAGFSLDEIAQMFSADKRPSIDRKMLASKADQIDAMITRMHAMSDSLRHAANCPATSHMECPSFQSTAEGRRRWDIGQPARKDRQRRSEPDMAPVRARSYRRFLSKNAIDSCARRSRNAARSKPCGSAATLPSGEGRSIVGVFMNA